MLRSFRSFDRPSQVLMLNQFTINVAFFMLFPFLPGYLTHDLGLAASVVGLIVGTRLLSQQGLFVLGGSLSDRVGYRPVIIAGCAARTVGFLAFGLLDSVPGLLVAAVLSGLAGSLFAPALRAYLALSSGPRRVEAFSVFNVFAQTGAMLGPLLGAALLGLSFRAVCLVAAAIFLLLTVLQVLYLPPREGGQVHATTSVLADWREALANRAFVLFALGMLGYFGLYNQVYMALPLEVRRVTGSDAAMSLVFLVYGGLGILAQVPITDYCKRHFAPLATIVLGLSLMGLAFAPLLLAGPFTPLGGPPYLAPLLPAAANLAPLLLATAILTIGRMLCEPFALDLIPSLGATRLVGTYYGLFFVATGLGAALGNLLVGAALELGLGLGLPVLHWLVLVLIGLLCAAAIAALDRLGLLNTPLPPPGSGRG